MSQPNLDYHVETTPTLWARLGLNRSTSALLAAILLIGMGQYLWQPFMPKFIEESIKSYLRTGAAPWGISVNVFVILAVGLYGTLNDLQEGIYYYLGGRIGGALGTRKALIGFTLLPLVGYGIMLAWLSPLAPFLAMPFILAYDSFSQPATLTVIGNTLKARHRTMAFSLQAIQRRIPRIIAILTGGALVTALSVIGGVRLSVAISGGLVLLAAIIQWCMLHSDAKDDAKATKSLSFGMIRQFHPELKKLLLADILARIAEGMPRELFILYAVVIEGAQPLTGFGAFGASFAVFASLVAIQAFTSLLTYIPVGYIASRPGGEKKPFIGLTFIFFALFPLAFWLLGGLRWQIGSHGVYLGLMIAYFIAGLREIGEPARKAMITELIPPEVKTAATGLYWSIRSFAVMLAPMLGAVVWLTISPAAAFIVASAVGFIGAILFAVLFNRQVAVSH